MIDDEALGFLVEFDKQEGVYRGSSPPSKFEESFLPEEEWDENWIDHTGNFEYSDSMPLKITECPCGSRQFSGNRARYIRCFECARILFDKEWEDDRVGNKRLEDPDSDYSSYKGEEDDSCAEEKQTGLSQFAGGV